MEILELKPANTSRRHGLDLLSVGIMGLLLILFYLFLRLYWFDWVFADDVNIILLYQRFFITHQVGLLDLLLSWENSHPIGVQAILTTMMLKIFGITLLPILCLSFAIIALSAVLLWTLTSKYLTSTVSRALAAPVLVMMVFHPTQMEHLVWPFEIGWFLIDFFLILNASLFERYGPKAVPAVALSCLLATFCSAHGVFLWWIAAAHCLMLAKGSFRNVAAAASLAAVGVVGAAFILLKVSSQKGDYSLAGTDLLHLPTYELLLLGGTFGLTDHAALAFISVATIAILGFVIVLLWRKAQFNAPERVSILLIAASAIFVSSFALGRAKFGVDWATSTFHGAPLFVPFLCGFAILSLRAFDGRPTSWIPILFLGGSFISSLPYGLSFADYSLMEHGLAMRTACDGSPSIALSERASGLYGHDDELNEAMPMLRALCTGASHGRAYRLLSFPREFQELAAADPRNADHLHSIWQSYITRLDLLRAFPIDDPQSPSRLLDWARSGS